MDPITKVVINLVGKTVTVDLYGLIIPAMKVNFMITIFKAKVKSIINILGKYCWFDGRVYDGDWKANKMHGEGIFTWPNGRKYVGSFAYDKKEGYGTHEW